MADELRLISVRRWDDTYFRFTMAESMLDTPEMQNLREAAKNKGYRVDSERLDTIEQAEEYLGITTDLRPKVRSYGDTESS